MLDPKGQVLFNLKHRSLGYCYEQQLSLPWATENVIQGRRQSKLQQSCSEPRGFCFDAPCSLISHRKEFHSESEWSKVREFID